MENGSARISQNLSALIKNLPGEVARALFEEAESIMAAAKELTPVDTGALRSTGHVQAPVIHGSEVSVRLGFGGPAVPYASVVHNDLSAHHDVGQAKYLEQPLTEWTANGKDNLADRIDLNRGLS